MTFACWTLRVLYGVFIGRFIINPSALACDRIEKYNECLYELFVVIIIDIACFADSTAISCAVPSIKFKV